MNELKKIEEDLFDKLSNKKSSEAVFILASPRTGSTPFYQALVQCGSLPYISNFTNTYYPNCPLIGLAIQHGIKQTTKLNSHFGKTDGSFEMSEGSEAFKFWFGGGHPSQLKSNKIIKKNEVHFKKTISSIYTIYNMPLVIKNAWNCFRVTDIVRLLPLAKFIWLKRNIADAAKSDLEARYITKKNPKEWNSATPWNFKELQSKPHTQQVVENQFEYNTAIKLSLDKLPKRNWTEIFYDDFISEPNKKITEILEFLDQKLKSNLDFGNIIKENKTLLSQDDSDAIDLYINDNKSRFDFLIKNKL